MIGPFLLDRFDSTMPRENGEEEQQNWPLRREQGVGSWRRARRMHGD